jgi:hypothetical protein
LLSALYLQNCFAKNTIEMPIYGATSGGIVLTGLEGIESYTLTQLTDNILKAIERFYITSSIYGGAIIIIDERVPKEAGYESERDFKKRMSEPLKVNYGVLPYFHILDPWFASGMTFDEAKMTSTVNTIKTIFDKQTTEEEGGGVLVDKEYYSKVQNPTQLRNPILTYEGRQITMGNIHPSRIIAKRQGFLNQNEQVLFRGWGVSVFEAIKPQLVNLIRGAGAVQKGLDANGILALKIDKKADKDRGQEYVQSLADNIKNAGLVALDINEDISGINISQQVQESMSILMSMYSAATKIPMSILYGLQSSGFSNDNISLESYYEYLNNIRGEMKPFILQLFDKTLSCVSEEYNSQLIKDIDVNFNKELSVQTLEQRTQLKHGQATLILQMYSDGIISEEQFQSFMDKIQYFPFDLKE